MSNRHPKFNEARSQQLLSALKGEAPPKVTVEPEKAMDVAGNVLEVLETLPDVNHKQRRISYMLARNNLPVEIAAEVGCTAAYVRALMLDPRITELVKIFRGGRIYDLAEDISAREILDRASARAAEVLAEKMNNAVDEGTQLRAAVEVLKATGEIGGSDRMTTQITIEKDVVTIFQKAMEEDQEEIEEGEYEEETLDNTED